MTVIYFQQRDHTGKKWHRPGHQTWNLTTFQTKPLWHTYILDQSQSLSLLAVHSKCSDASNLGWVFRQHSTSETTRMYKFIVPILSVVAGTQQRKLSCTKHTEASHRTLKHTPQPQWVRWTWKKGKSLETQVRASSNYQDKWKFTHFFYPFQTIPQ